jgi:hypothetical protein
MRKITRQIVDAFWNRKPMTKGNSCVARLPDGTAHMVLHGSIIATHGPNGEVSITTAGWNTVTTKERLNGIPGVSITQKNFELYLNGDKWDGSWTTV